MLDLGAIKRSDSSFECMPFGITDVPVMFQRCMGTCLGDLCLNWCMTYLDDTIIFSKTPREDINSYKEYLKC